MVNKKHVIYNTLHMILFIINIPRKLISSQSRRSWLNQNPRFWFFFPALPKDFAVSSLCVLFYGYVGTPLHTVFLSTFASRYSAGYLIVKSFLGNWLYRKRDLFPRVRTPAKGWDHDLASQTVHHHPMVSEDNLLGRHRVIWPGKEKIILIFV